jgi:hypothetical protein
MEKNSSAERGQAKISELLAKGGFIAVYCGKHME